MKSVNWKATAKTGELKVNEKNFTSLKAIRIFLNLEDSGIHKNEELVEASIRIGATVAENFLMQGLKVSMYANLEDVITGKIMEVKESSGNAHMTHIYKALARLNEKKTAIKFSKCLKEQVEQDERGTMTVFIAPNWYPDFEKELLEYQAKGLDFVCFLVRQKEDVEIAPELSRVVKVFNVGGEVLS